MRLYISVFVSHRYYSCGLFMCVRAWDWKVANLGQSPCTAMHSGSCGTTVTLICPRLGGPIFARASLSSEVVSGARFYLIASLALCGGER